MSKMSSGWEKSVKGATKIKLAAPKSKYIEHILIATHTGEAGVAEVFRTLQHRLRDSTWTIVFKSLIVVHIMMREGSQDATLQYLASSPKRKLAINNLAEVQTQGRNIRSYADYLTQRATCFASTKVDYVRRGEKRLKGLSVDKGLLRETESVQEQIRSLLKCDFLSHEPENEITLTAFRLLTMDLLALFHVMNEGTINILEHFFEMSKPDADRALRIYRSFCKQTELVVRYLSIARHYEHATRLEIPKIKHAPTSLASSLEEYIKDPDFDINRRQYLAQQEAKRTGKPVDLSSISKEVTASSSSAFPDVKKSTTEQPKTQTKGPAPDLIDFFESIEQNQTPMAQAAYQQPQYAPQMVGQQQPVTFGAQITGMPQQQTGYGVVSPIQPQSTNPFLSMGQPQQQQQQVGMQPSYTGQSSPFNTFGQPTQQQQQRFTTNLSAIPQSSIASFPGQQQPFATGMTDASSTPISVQSTNPFRQSMIGSSMTGTSLSSFGSSPMSVQPTGSTNPFSKPPTSAPNNQSSPFGAAQTQSPFGQNASTPFSPIGGPSPFQSQPQTPLAPMPTGSTNPFAKPAAPNQPQQNPMVPQATGSTNPFRQSAFVSSSGVGWQSGVSQGTIGGLNSNTVETVPIFPRPGM